MTTALQIALPVEYAQRTSRDSIARMDRHLRRRAFGLAMQQAREHTMTQAQLAIELDTTQGTVSGWEKGRTEPAPEVVEAIEQALRLTPGTLSRHLGYLPLSYDGSPAQATVTEAILGDQRLDDDGRSAMLGTYRALTRRRPG